MIRRLLASCLLIAGMGLPLHAWAVDTDNDGLQDAEEPLYGTNSTNPDSDSDGIVDGWEVLLGDNPLASRYPLSSQIFRSAFATSGACSGGTVYGKINATSDSGYKVWTIGTISGSFGGVSEDLTNKYKVPGQVTLGTTTTYHHDSVGFTCSATASTLTCQRDTESYAVTFSGQCSGKQPTLLSTGISPSPWTQPVNNPLQVVTSKDRVCVLNRDFTVQCFDVSNWSNPVPVAWGGGALVFDADKDGMPNADDPDDDNDGTLDINDSDPLNPFVGGVDNDFDKDGIQNSADNCLLNSNADQADDDGDGRGNPCDVGAAGKLDINFKIGRGPVDDIFVNGSASVYVTAVQADGKILIGGSFTRFNGIARKHIARLNADGSLDTTFNPGVMQTGWVMAIAVQADGKILVGGSYGILRRLNADGSLDASFNSVVGSYDYVYAIALQADGKAVIGGDFVNYNGTVVNRIARLNTDGSLDASFLSGSAANSTVNGVAIQSDGKIIISGGFTSYNGAAAAGIARLNADGSLDTGFSPAATGSDIVLQNDGKILVNGSTSRIARLNVDGSLDASFNPGSGASYPVYSIIVQADGKIIAAGAFTSFNGAAAKYIVRLNADGSVDHSFNPGSGADYYIIAAAIQADGRVVIGGSFTMYNGAYVEKVTRIHTGDPDYDGVEDAADNCTVVANADQNDSDGNDIGDACDIDTDNDGVPDGADKFPLDASESADTDNDGIGNNADTDDENDGVADNIDNCPLIVNSDQLNTDGDAQGNICDSDDDNDGVADSSDKFPLNAAASSDTDNDGFPSSWNAACDATCQSNSGLALDNCPLNANADQLNTDGDSQGNVCDSDDDNDGVPDANDAFPLDASESADTDGDGIGDNADTTPNGDTDSDGVDNASDNCVAVANADQKDTDSDGAGDVCDVTPNVNAGGIAAGSLYTCALTAGGGVKCWGANYSGQLGDNTTANKLLPVDVVGLGSGVTAIAAGDAHTCVVTSGGAVKCWGANSSGQLGDNTTANKLLPVDVVGLGSGVTAIAAGAYHTCALMAGGAVKCWGHNVEGQLGDNTTVDRRVPVDVVGLGSGITAVVAGYGHNCALTVGGGMKCWGDNYGGQLGDNTRVDRLAPVDVVGLGSGVSAMAAGHYHSCALTAGGAIKCWGSNDFGQLGDNTGVGKLVPVYVAGFMGNADADGDGVVDSSDNCPSVSNADQLDTDSDSEGNACDNDDDNDGVLDTSDAFPLDASESADTDGDGIGNNADTTPNGDSDSDGIDNSADNCVSVANADQLNTDGDSEGNACDSDDDNDGVADTSDAFPLDASESADTDGDSIGDNADTTPNGDTDSDGIDNAADNCPAVSNVDQLNSDGDSEGNACDTDDDNDNVADTSDAFPLNASESADTDGDGIGNNADTTPNGDTDSDGIDNLSDNCPSVSNVDQLNTDGDSEGNACDTDDDNDGIADGSDAFPLDASESADTDGDGIGDNTDNCVDAANADQLNTDGDAQGDACDVFVNDPTLLLQQDGTAKNEKLGSSVALADMNNDGVVDLLVGSPLANVTINGTVLKKAGQIQIISSKDNSVLRTINGSAANAQLGAAIAVVADQNKDGVRDIVVGDPLADITVLAPNGFAVLKDAGRVLLYSGRDGRMLLILAEGKNVGDHFGAAVAAADVNGDGKLDLIVGTPRADISVKDAGQVTAFNGLGNKILYQRNGEQAGENFGAAVAVDNGHLLVGSPLFDTVTLKDAGRVSVFNSSEGSSAALLAVEGSAQGDNFGASVTAANDSWAVGIPLADSVSKAAGSVQIFTGLNAIPTKTMNGTTAGDNFGNAINMQGDVDMDGKNDIAVGAAKFDVNKTVNSRAVLLKDAGRVQVLSGTAL